ncbi:uncharacterized protein LOC26526836 [Drosophila erecta]|uniref:Uncharacterized protein n=1 Tax=Drosophila erecta TaxID=7220 RepID=A0A0Q5TGH9_DROER|nr:uncharacterized protein LOC26526836 [Drosophila erecta]KQS29975.1 uncharacterized protein Dere_GG27012 [Drosophila erecta]
MTSMALLAMIYIFMAILGYWQVEGGRPAKRPTVYDYDDESEMFEKMADQDYQIQSNIHSSENEDPMGEALDTSDLDMNLDYRMGRNEARSQRKSHLKFPESWAKLIKEAEPQMDPKK